MEGWRWVETGLWRKSRVWPRMKWTGGIPLRKAQERSAGWICVMCSGHCPRCTGHAHCPLSMTAECLCFSVCPQPRPFVHTSMLSSNVASSVKISLASWVKLIMAFLPSFPPLCPYITATHFLLPHSRGAICIPPHCAC